MEPIAVDPDRLAGLVARIAEATRVLAHPRALDRSADAPAGELLGSGLVVAALADAATAWRAYLSDLHRGTDGTAAVLRHVAGGYALAQRRVEDEVRAVTA